MQKSRSSQLLSVFIVAFIAQMQSWGLAQDNPATRSLQNSVTVFGIEFDKADLAAGYVFGNLKAKNFGDFDMAHLMLRLGKTINHWFNLKDHKGTISLYFQPFIGPIFSPENGLALGEQIYIEYAYPLTADLTFLTGFRSGPMYFGIDTIEQGSAGFNFYDTAKGGFSYRLKTEHRFFIEYHAAHISNLGLRDKNNGINAYGAVVGMTKKF